MTTKLYVGNLPYSTTEDELSRLFAQAGTVTSVAIPVDKQTGQVRGFAFVEMSTEAEAKKAIGMLNGHMVGQRQIRVNVSEPRDPNRQAPRQSDNRSTRSRY